MNVLKMLVISMTLLCVVSSVSAETYEQCKKRILDDIAKVEQKLGRKLLNKTRTYLSKHIVTKSVIKEIK